MNKQFDFFYKNFQLFYDTKDVIIDYGRSTGAKIAISKTAHTHTHTHTVQK